MAQNSDRLIRLYRKADDGNLHDTGQTLDVDKEFCGSLPRVGDLIVSRWLRNSKEDARLWSNRSVLVVEAVYYRPDKHLAETSDSWVVLVVSERMMTEQEWALL